MTRFWALALLFCASTALAQPMGGTPRYVVFQDTVTITGTTASVPIPNLANSHLGICVWELTALAGGAPSVSAFLQSVLPDGTIDDYVAFGVTSSAPSKIVTSFNTAAFPRTAHAPFDAGIAATPGVGPFGTTLRAKVLFGGTTTSLSYRITCTIAG